MANDIVAAVISQYKTPVGFKIVIPTDTTSLIASGQEDEAHFICAAINSLPIREFIKSYSSAGRGFGTPSVMSYVGIPKYDPKDEIHTNLSRLSRSLHELKQKNQLDQVELLEKEVDDCVHELFGIKPD